MEVLTQNLVFHALVLLFVWVPFALVAFWMDVVAPERDHARQDAGARRPTRPLRPSLVP